MTTKKHAHKHTLKIGNVTLVIQWNGEFAFEVPSSVSTDKLAAFKKKYAEEITEFKKLENLIIRSKI